ncbi:hypothetical protein GCM10020331_026800 [Ectobacillus funiculus]
MRKHDPMGDFGRAQRQRQVLGALVEKLNSPSVVTKLDDIAEIIGKHVKKPISQFLMAWLYIKKILWL